MMETLKNVDNSLAKMCGNVVANVNAKPTVYNTGHIVCVLLEACVPLVEDNTADTTQTQQQSSLQRFLQG